MRLRSTGSRSRRHRSFPGATALAELRWRWHTLFTGLATRRRRARRARAHAGPGGVFDAVLGGVSVAMILASLGLAGAGIAIGSDDLPEPQPTTSPAAAAPDEPKFVSLTPSAPVRLEVPSLDIEAPIVPIQVSADSVLEPPSDPLEVGWWDLSARPGADTGQTVITGHTVHTGGGAMDRLPELEKGSRVNVVTRKGTMRYKVYRTAALTRDDVVKYAQDLFGQDRGVGQLMLVSCTDWNGSFYERNIFSLALPLGQRNKQHHKQA